MFYNGIGNGFFLARDSGKLLTMGSTVLLSSYVEQNMLFMPVSVMPAPQHTTPVASSAQV